MSKRTAAPISLRGILIFVGSIFFLASAGPAATKEVPKWELGLGAGGAYLPDYRGSDEYETYIVPWPYVVYRGSRFSVDREGLRGQIFGSPTLSLVGSVNASTPVNSEDNLARMGMPDLGFAFELGPMLEMDMWHGPRRERVSLQFPLRAVIVTDFARYDGAGWIFAPRVYWGAPYFEPGDIDLDAGIGVIFASNEYHDYYYEVAPAHVTPTRPAYDARAGYSGMRVSLGASKRIGDVWMGAYLRYDNLAGAVFGDSPLMRSDDVFVVGAGVAYVFMRSNARVER